MDFVGAKMKFCTFCLWIPWEVRHVSICKFTKLSQSLGFSALITGIFPLGNWSGTNYYYYVMGTWATRGSAAAMKGYLH